MGVDQVRLRHLNFARGQALTLPPISPRKWLDSVLFVI